VRGQVANDLLGDPANREPQDGTGPARGARISSTSLTSESGTDGCECPRRVGIGVEQPDQLGQCTEPDRVDEEVDLARVRSVLLEHVVEHPTEVVSIVEHAVADLVHDVAYSEMDVHRASPWIERAFSQL
jgi:hypothetical protein